MSALPVAMTLSGTTVTIPANVLFATATITGNSGVSGFFINNVYFNHSNIDRFQGFQGYQVGVPDRGANPSITLSREPEEQKGSTQGIALKAGDVVKGPQDSVVSINLVAYTS